MREQPGRLRGRLPVLRDGGAGVRARSLRRGDRRPGPACPPQARPQEPSPHESRVHGDGRAAPQHRGRARGDRRPHRSCPLRPRRAACHGLHVGGRARHGAHQRAAAAVDAGRVAACGTEPAPRPPRPAEPALAGGTGRGCRARVRPADPPARELRVRADRRDQRHAGGRRGAGRAPSRDGRPRQLHPDEPGRPHPVAGEQPGAHRRVRRAGGRGRDRRHGAAQPRSGGRGGLRPARGGAGRFATCSRGGPPARPARCRIRDRLGRGRGAGAAPSAKGRPGRRRRAGLPRPGMRGAGRPPDQAPGKRPGAASRPAGAAGRDGSGRGGAGRTGTGPPTRSGHGGKVRGPAPAPRPRRSR